LEREKLDKIQAEITRGSTGGFDQGKKAKAGHLVGADAMLFGDIVIFGRDDSHKKNGIGSVLGTLGGRLGAAAGNARTTDKAVVAINLRVVDTETGETIQGMGFEARGESKRTGTNWGAVAGGWKYGAGGAGAGAGSSTMPSNFADTIIGEATQDAVNKIAVFLDEKASGMSLKARTIEGGVASINGCQLYLSVGGTDGVQVGDRFEIHKILNEVLDPKTKEVLDEQTEKVGEFVVGTVRDKVSIGQYGGAGLDPNYQKGYAARMVSQ
jgi:hypothetical protein